MKKDNKRFYERYKEEQKHRQKEEQLRKRYNIEDDKKVVIKDETAIDKGFFYFGKIISGIGRWIFYLVIFILSSIGATVLMNEPLRETFFSLLKTVF